MLLIWYISSYIRVQKMLWNFSGCKKIRDRWLKGVSTWWERYWLKGLRNIPKVRNFRLRQNQMCLRCWQQTIGKQGHPHHLKLVKQSNLMLGNYILCREKKNKPFWAWQMEKMEFSVPRSYSSGKQSWALSESKLSVRLSSRSVIC